jgi:hypothetical protein
VLNAQAIPRAQARIVLGAGGPGHLEQEGGARLEREVRVHHLVEVGAVHGEVGAVVQHLARVRDRVRVGVRVGVGVGFRVGVRVRVRVRVRVGARVRVRVGARARARVRVRLGAVVQHHGWPAEEGLVTRVQHHVAAHLG